MKKELKIEVPQGYEIDKEKSTFEKIIFKKIPENPKTWEEYCECIKDCTSHYCHPRETYIRKTFDRFYNEFSTKERVKQYVALGKLLQLRDYWVRGGYEDFDYALFGTKTGEIFTVSLIGDTSYPLTFPTREMADDFKKCFSDLIKEAYPLV